MSKPFNLTEATRPQWLALNAITEIARNTPERRSSAMGWKAGPFGSTYAEVTDSNGEKALIYISAEGTVELQYPPQ